MTLVPKRSFTRVFRPSKTNMNASLPNTLPTENAATGYVPVLDPATATVEETDEWILASGGELLSPE